MFINNVQLAWQFYQQEKHYADQRFLRWTQVILMVFIVTLSQTSDSVQRYLTQNLTDLLGADLVISQQKPLTEAQQAQLESMSERIVLTKNIATTLTHNKGWQQANLKAVGSDYPLQGELQTAVSLGSSEESTLSGPKPGKIWLDTRLFASLSLQIGDTLTLANHGFEVARVLKHEPDRLMEGHNLDMRAMINLADIQKLQFPEDIIRHRYLLAANASQTSDIIEWHKANLPVAQIHHKKGAHPLALFWQRTENFIGLASIILFFMAAIAIEQLTNVQMRKEQYFSAICMSLGASKVAGFQISLLKWLLRMLFVLPIVLVISAICHALLIHWLSNTFEDLTWHVNIPLVLKSVLAISAIFLIFQVPVWMGLKQSSVAQLVNNVTHRVSYWFSLACAIAVLAAVAFTYSDNALLTAMVLIAMAICVLLILLISWLGLSLGEKLTQNLSGLIPFALFMMKQRLVSKSTQILGVGLCAFLLLFTLMLMKDLGDTMASYQRQHDGNLFVSQASKEQMKDIALWANTHDIELRQSKPYMYAMLVQVNGQTLSEFSQTPSDSLATFKRSIRLHWTDAVPSNNRVVEGQWWGQDSNHWQQVSIEQEVMTDIGLNIGDKLTFYVGEQNIDFHITASHAMKPGGGTITFWVQMPPAALAHIQAPHYNMASLELTEQQFSLLGNLWHQHPSLRMLSLKELTVRFDTTLAMVTQVISGFSLIIITLAFIVVFSSCHSLEAREKKKNSIIMSFGFTKQTCLKLNIIEWLVTGLIAASGAIAGTYVAGLLIYQSQFSLSYKPDLLWLMGTLAVILVIVTSLGVYASKKSLSSSIRALMVEQ
jgi:putative ABC transport system permease protein